MIFVDERAITLRFSVRSEEDPKIYVDELIEWLKENQLLYDHMRGIFDIFIPEGSEIKVWVKK